MSWSPDACDFVVKPVDGLDVNAFSCWVKFHQEDYDEEHSFYLNPGFKPLQVEKKILAAIGEAFNFFFF